MVLQIIRIIIIIIIFYFFKFWSFLFPLPLIQGSPAAGAATRPFPYVFITLIRA